MYIELPNSPVRKIFKCGNCENYHIQFYNSKLDRTYTPSEWEKIMTDGRESLDKALRLIRDDPKFFG
tara:strand:- start:45 stop:245 length:201 start_codon:yes stop_codon:yes gene_type:complete